MMEMCGVQRFTCIIPGYCVVFQELRESGSTRHHLSTPATSVKGMKLQHQKTEGSSVRSGPPDRLEVPTSIYALYIWVHAGLLLRVHPWATSSDLIKLMALAAHTLAPIQSLVQRSVEPKEPARGWCQVLHHMCCSSWCCLQKRTASTWLAARIACMCRPRAVYRLCLRSPFTCLISWMSHQVMLMQLLPWWPPH